MRFNLYLPVVFNRRGRRLLQAAPNRAGLCSAGT